MKYLKTFEHYKYLIDPEKWSLLVKIIEFFDENQIDKIEIPETYMSTFDEWVRYVQIFRNEIEVNGKKESTPVILFNYNIDDTLIWIDDKFDIKDFRALYQSLMKLTPEEIEEQKAKQEAEKFNF